MNLITIEDGGRLRGIDDVFGDLDASASDERLVEELDRAGLPYQTAMGSFDDWQRRLRELLRPRQLVSIDHETCDVPILEFHIPPQGTGELVATRSEERAGTVGISIYGTGRTSGCAAKVSLSEKFEPRTSCLAVNAELRVSRCVYRVGDEQQIEWSPEATIGYRHVERKNCERCGVARGSLDAWTNDLGEYLDFRGDSLSHTRKIDVKWSDDRITKLGLKVGDIGEVGFIMKSQSEVIWAVEYKFSPGLLYQPYWPQEGAPLLRSPAWAIEAL